ncbi:MAG: alcohol dehydrogenase catalytic domain-containing protein [Deltaproteobacteria bacterium]|nr:alcohol dehydrogenase catalytic domain-containing protein [Deltaproteobacteria bacterium]
MRALHWDGERLTLALSHPAPKSDDVTALVRVRLAGICSTDLQILKGYMGFHGIPGHEFVGEVSDGPVELVGRRVVGEINFACGRCESCAGGFRRHCPNRRVMGILGADGSFAEYLSIPAENLHAVPGNLDNDEAVFIEPLAAAFEILEQVEIDFTSKVLVLGDGKLGLLCAQVLSLTGARVTLVGRHPKKLGLVKKFGIRTDVLADWRPTPVDVVIEATGSSTGLEMALSAARSRGTIVMKSTVAREHTLSLAPLVINEVTVVGSRCGRFPPALEALAQGKIAVKPLIEKVYPLSHGVDALQHAAQPGTLKVLLKI